MAGRYSKVLVKNRNKAAKRLLEQEILICGIYNEEMKNNVGFAGQTPDMQAYKHHIVVAYGQTLAYLDSAPNGKELICLFQLRYVEHLSVDAICIKLNISAGTYYNWRNKILKIFSQFSSIPI